MMRFYSPHDVQLRVVFITGALQQGFFFFFFTQVPTAAAATTFIRADSRTPVQNKNTDYV